MKEPHRVPFQDAIAVAGREIKLIQDGRRVFDVLGGEIIGANDDAVVSDQAYEETEGLRIINQIVVMKAAQVVAKRVLERCRVISHVEQKMFDASCKVGEGAARMR